MGHFLDARYRSCSMTTPDYILRNLFANAFKRDLLRGFEGLHQGRRLPAWKKYEQPVLGPMRQRHGLVCGYDKHFRLNPPREEKGNLPEAEYRFWSGSQYGSSHFARCRTCGFQLFDYNYVEGSRALHLRSGHCAPILIEAYRRIRVWEKCACCGDPTFKGDEKWGIPLHRGNCQSAWRWKSFDGKTFERALIQAREALKDMYKCETSQPK